MKQHNNYRNAYSKNKDLKNVKENTDREVNDEVSVEVNTEADSKQQNETGIDDVLVAERAATPIYYGEVKGCDFLRIRERPNTTCEILGELEIGDRVEIDKSASTDEFYKVCTEFGVNGYCMKQFIDII